MNRFADRLKMLRIENGWTGEELAAKVGLGKSGISSYESRQRACSHDLLIEFSKVFDVSVDYLLGASDYRHVKEEPIDESTEGFTVKLVKQLIENDVIKNADRIPAEITKMIIIALKSDLKKRT